MRRDLAAIRSARRSYPKNAGSCSQLSRRGSDMESSRRLGKRTRRPYGAVQFPPTPMRRAGPIHRVRTTCRSNGAWQAGIACQYLSAPACVELADKRASAAALGAELRWRSGTLKIARGFRAGRPNFPGSRGEPDFPRTVTPSGAGGCSRLFRDFIEKHCLAADVDRKVLEELYSVRSALAHGRYLFQFDEAPTSNVATSVASCCRGT